MLADADVDAVVIATPVSTHHELAPRRCAAGKHVFVEKPLAASLDAGARAAAARARARPGADAGPHVPLQPAREQDPRADPVGRARRDLLHLDEPREPRPAPVRRQRRLGPRPARLLDPALLARRGADARLGAVARLRHARHARRRVHQPRVRVRDDRARRALVARAEQAAPDDDRRLAQDGRLRRHEQRAGAGLRLGRDRARPGQLRRVPAHLPHRRHRLAARRRRRAAPARDGRLLPRRRRTAAIPARPPSSVSTSSG